MKKDGTITLFVVLLILSLILIVSAQETTDDAKVSKAYTCLEAKIKDKCDSLSVEEQAFTVLATGKCSSELEDNSKDKKGECWPSTCRLRDTALGVLAFDRVGRSTTDAEKWLLSKKKIPKDLIWYLEIDADEETECTIKYEAAEKKIRIGENKKINTGAGACLSLAQDNYWLKIKDSCYEANFTISCDKDFKTTLLYSKKDSSTIYVSSKTNLASAEGETEERVNAFCFGLNDCDYEGSLWATLALSQAGKDVSSFLPYLIALAEENEKYFPSTFLYMITEYDDYFTQIINEQTNDYWRISNSPYSKYYDTSLALLALYGTSAEQLSSAKSYLLEVQEENGCWDGVRDTAFILFAGWRKTVSSVTGGDVDECEEYNYSCESSLECSQEDRVVGNFVCYGGKVCCRTAAVEETCDDKNGIECEEDQTCSGAEVPASDTSSCCVGSCTTIEVIACEENEYICRTSCLDDEEEKSFECNEDKLCCGTKTTPKPSYWWVWLLIILIILVVLGIIFRNRLRVLLFKFRRGGQAPSQPRQGFPPTAPPVGMPRARPRMIIPRQLPPPRQQPRPPTRPTTRTDQEFEETLKKLKEMSK